jgi:vacuolar-type H+-ATPase subunit F/Vma7
MSTNSGYKIAIIGPSDTVSGFRALGVVSFAATDAEAVLEHLRAIKQANDAKQGEQYAVVCIIETLLSDVDQAEFKKLTSAALPAVVTLPGPDGSTGFAINRLRALAEQAVGSAII